MTYMNKKSPTETSSSEVSNSHVGSLKLNDQRASAAVQFKQQQVMRAAHSPNIIQQMAAEQGPIEGEFKNETSAQLQDAPAAKPNHTGMSDNLKSGIKPTMQMKPDEFIKGDANLNNHDRNTIQMVEIYRKRNGNYDVNDKNRESAFNSDRWTVDEYENFLMAHDDHLTDRLRDRLFLELTPKAMMALRSAQMHHAQEKEVLNNQIIAKENQLVIARGHIADEKKAHTVKSALYDQGLPVILSLFGNVVNPINAILNNAGKLDVSMGTMAGVTALQIASDIALIVRTKSKEVRAYVAAAMLLQAASTMMAAAPGTDASLFQTVITSQNSTQYNQTMSEPSVSTESNSAMQWVFLGLSLVLVIAALLFRFIAGMRLSSKEGKKYQNVLNSISANANNI